jgi:hypothetical protein
MLSKEITEILPYECPVAIVTNSTSGPHVVGTWNTYLEILDDSTLAIPAFGYRQTEQNVKHGSVIHLLLATKELLGKTGRPGRGFKLTGRGSFETKGAIFEKMRSRFNGIRSAFIITIEQVEQQL